MKNSGFTIVELLIAFSIGIMVIVGGIVAGNKFNANQKVNTLTSEIEENIRLAKNYAMTRQSPTGFAAGLGHVEVRLNANGLMEIIPGNNNAVDETHKFLTKNISIEGITITKSIAQGKLIFSVPEGKLVLYKDGVGPSTIPAGIGDSVTVEVQSVEDPASFGFVTIETSGLIKSGAFKK